MSANRRRLRCRPRACSPKPCWDWARRPRRSIRTASASGATMRRRSCRPRSEPLHRATAIRTWVSRSAISPMPSPSCAQHPFPRPPISDRSLPKSQKATRFATWAAWTTRSSWRQGRGPVRERRDQGRRPQRRDAGEVPGNVRRGPQQRCRQGCGGRVHAARRWAGDAPRGRQEGHGAAVFEGKDRRQEESGAGHDGKDATAGKAGGRGAATPPAAAAGAGDKGEVV